MKVLITGGTGFVGSGVIRELLSHSHSVTALGRNAEAIAKLKSAGVKTVPGDIADVAALRDAVTDQDAVIHCAFIHDFANFAASIRTDFLAVEAMIEGLIAAGGSRIFINTAGTAMLAPGQLAVETNTPSAASPAAGRGPSDRITLEAAARGLRTAVVRLPPSVHGQEKHGFVPMLIGLARKTGVAAYIGNGENRWPAVHRDDAAVLYRLALEGLADGSIPAGTALHAVADPGIPFREIAQTIADRLTLGPAVVRPPAHFDWMGMFAGIDNPASAAITERLTGWRPTRPGLLADIQSPAYDDVLFGNGH